jgi:hypothetical protein
LFDNRRHSEGGYDMSRVRGEGVAGAAEPVPIDVQGRLPRAARAAARLIALAAAIGLAGCSAAHYGSPRPPADGVESHASGRDEAPGSLARLDVEKIRYSQASYSVTGDTEDGNSYSVQDNIEWLRDHPGEDLPWGGPIRVFRKQAFMDAWGPLARGSFVGDPVKLENGVIYTLDHRRLVAYREAGRSTIAVEWANVRLVRDQRWKFTTANGGRSIEAVP